jgi:hypothetical protein
VLTKLKLRMREPLLPLRKRLLHGGGLAVAWLVLLLLLSQGNPWTVLAAVALSGLQLWMWVFGPNAHEAPGRNK